jgi:hypothetical protein
VCALHEHCACVFVCAVCVHCACIVCALCVHSVCGWVVVWVGVRHRLIEPKHVKEGGIWGDG